MRGRNCRGSALSRGEIGGSSGRYERGRDCIGACGPMNSGTVACRGERGEIRDRAALVRAQFLQSACGMSPRVRLGQMRARS